MIGLTYQRYLQVRIADGLESAPVAFEAVCRCFSLQPKRHTQGIDNIDILAFAAIGHIRRTRSCSADRRSERCIVFRISQSAERSRTTIAERINRAGR